MCGYEEKHRTRPLQASPTKRLIPAAGEAGHHVLLGGTVNTEQSIRENTEAGLEPACDFHLYHDDPGVGFKASLVLVSSSVK